MQCFQCGKALSYDEIGLTRKLIRRDAVQCLCIGCLSRKFGVSVSRLQEKIEEYRAAGCSLFAAPEKPAVPPPRSD